jgi:hypothetical protein
MPVDTATTDGDKIKDVARVLTANSRPIAVVGDMEDVQNRYDGFLQYARKMLQKEGDNRLTIRPSQDESQVLFVRDDTYLPDNLNFED